MTRLELLADLATVYTYVGIDFQVNSSDGHQPAYITNHSVLVYEAGLSEINKKPVLKSKYISFSIYNIGEVDEKAYYIESEPINDVNSDVTGTGTYVDIHKMYISESMRGRVQAAVAFAAQDVLNEAIPEDDLASNAASGQNVVIVTRGFMFWPGKVIVVQDDNNIEEATVYNISGNNLYLTGNLTNSYTTEANGVIKYLNDTERQQWAANALLNPDAFTLSITSLVAMSPTIQAAGGLATDTEIKFVVDSYINKIASASYL